MRVAEQEKEAFRELGQAVLGLGWVYRVAGMFGVAVRTAQRWASGASTVPLPVLDELQRQREILAKSGLSHKILTAIREAEEEGLSPHITSAVLKDYAVWVKPDEENKDKSSNP